MLQMIWAIYYKSLAWFKAIFEGIPLRLTTIWGDQPAGKVVINCPEMMIMIIVGQHLELWMNYNISPMHFPGLKSVPS